MQLLKDKEAQKSKLLQGWLYICGDWLYDYKNQKVRKYEASPHDEIIEVDNFEDADWSFLKDSFGLYG